MELNKKKPGFAAGRQPPTYFYVTWKMWRTLTVCHGCHLPIPSLFLQRTKATWPQSFLNKNKMTNNTVQITWANMDDTARIDTLNTPLWLSTHFMLWICPCFNKNIKYCFYHDENKIPKLWMHILQMQSLSWMITSINWTLLQMTMLFTYLAVFIVTVKLKILELRHQITQRKQ